MRLIRRGLPAPAEHGKVLIEDVTAPDGVDDLTVTPEDRNGDGGVPS